MNDIDVKLKTTGKKLDSFKLRSLLPRSLFLWRQTMAAMAATATAATAATATAAIQIVLSKLSALVSRMCFIFQWTLNDRVGSANNCSNHHYKSLHECKKGEKIGLMVFPLFFNTHSFTAQMYIHHNRWGENSSIYRYQSRRWLFQQHYYHQSNIRIIYYWFVDWIPRISKLKRKREKKNWIELRWHKCPVVVTRTWYIWMWWYTVQSRMTCSTGFTSTDVHVCYHQHLYSNDNKVIYKTSHLRWGKMQNGTREKKAKVQNASAKWQERKRQQKESKSKQREKKFANYHTFYEFIRWYLLPECVGGLREILISRVVLNISHLTVRFGNTVEKSQFHAKLNWNSDHTRITWSVYSWSALKTNINTFKTMHKVQALGEG